MSTLSSWIGIEIYSNESTGSGTYVGGPWVRTILKTLRRTQKRYRPRSRLQRQGEQFGALVQPRPRPAY